MILIGERQLDEESGHVYVAQENNVSCCGFLDMADTV